MPEKGDVFLCKFCGKDAYKVIKGFPDSIILEEALLYLRYINGRRIKDTDAVHACYKHREEVSRSIGFPLMKKKQT